MSASCGAAALLDQGLPLLTFPRVVPASALDAARPYPLTRVVTDAAHTIALHCWVCDRELARLVAGLEQPGRGHAGDCPVADVQPGHGMVRIGGCPRCGGAFEVPKPLHQALQGALPCPTCEGSALQRGA